MSKENKKVSMVKKPHNLITAKIHFGVREQNLIQMLMVSVNKSASNDYFNDQKSETKKLVYEYHVSDIAKAMGIAKSSLTRDCGNESLKAQYGKDKNKVTLLEESANKLWNYDVWIRGDNGAWEAHRILQRMSYKNETLLLHLTESYHSEMLKLTEKGFGKIDVGIYYSLKSHVAQRIFELATRFAGMNKVYETTVGNFCEMIGVKLSDYSRPASFRTCCLIRPIDKIMKAAGYEWEKVSKDGFSLIKNERDKINESTVLRLDLRPKKSRMDEIIKRENAKLVELFNAVIEMKLQNKSQLLELLESIDKLNENERKVLKIEKSAEFIKNWAALMSTSSD